MLNELVKHIAEQTVTSKEDLIWSILPPISVSEPVRVRSDNITTPEQQKLLKSLIEGYFQRIGDHLISQHKVSVFKPQLLIFFSRFC